MEADFVIQGFHTTVDLLPVLSMKILRFNLESKMWTVAVVSW